VQNKQQAREDEAKAAKERRKKVSDCPQARAHMDVSPIPRPLPLQHGTVADVAMRCRWHCQRIDL
jgi:hypothetical protein